MWLNQSTPKRPVEKILSGLETGSVPVRTEVMLGPNRFVVYRTST